MQLPGGLLRNGVRRRDFAFRPLTGAVELALAEAAGAEEPTPVRVTGALVATLEQLGGEMPSPETVSALAVADRQYLMGNLAAELGLGEGWYTACCGQCRENFDFAVNCRELPVKEAGESYPVVAVETSRGSYVFRVPTGADQVFLAGLADDEAAQRLLLERCLSGAGDASRAVREEVAAFTADDILRIEAALESLAPEVAVAVQAVCPGCGSTRTLEVDPYRALSRQTGSGLLQEVHILASTYHWSETEILALPSRRRRSYLALIDQARGMDQ